LLCRLWF
nr:immunoglobulin heavy chain junction region [Mus musculus]